MVRDLTQIPTTQNPLLDPTVACCDTLNNHFADKICQIGTDPNAGIIAEVVSEVSSNSLNNLRLDQFESVSTKDVDKLLGNVKKTICPSWPVIQGGDALRSHLRYIMNASLREGYFPQCLKEVVVRLPLKKPSLDL